MTRAPVHTAEEAYLAALMTYSHERAGALVEMLAPDDFAAPALRLVHHLIGQLCEAHVDPDAAAVLAVAIGEEHAVGEVRIHAFTEVLCRLIDHRAGNNPASIRWYAARALEQAVRRRAWEMAARLAQVADHAELSELDRLRAAEQAAVDTIRARHRALTEGRVAA